MIQTIRNAWSVPELRKKILFTIFALLIFRLGSAIPVPYINSEQLGFYLEAQSGTILGLMSAMSGSSLTMRLRIAASATSTPNQIGTVHHTSRHSSSQSATRAAARSWDNRRSPTTHPAQSPVARPRMASMGRTDFADVE